MTPFGWPDPDIFPSGLMKKKLPLCGIPQPPTKEDKLAGSSVCDCSSSVWDDFLSAVEVVVVLVDSMFFSFILLLDDSFTVEVTVVDDPFVFSVFVFSLVQAVSNNNAKTSERDFFICNHSFQSIHKFSNVNNCCKKLYHTIKI